MSKKTLLRSLIISIGVAASIGAAIVVWGLLHRKQTLIKTVDDMACVVHKVRPAYYPKVPILIFVNRNGDEFITMRQDIWRSLNEGDCVKYRYTEYYEHDGDPSKAVFKNYIYNIIPLDKHDGIMDHPPEKKEKEDRSI